MAWESHNGIIEPGFKAASAIGPKMPVKLDTTANQVVAAATTTDRPLGFTIASAPQGGGIAIMGPHNTVKAVAAASLGYGAELGIASTNGALGPITGASGVGKWAIGTSREPAAAGETFSVHVHPRQLSGLI